MIQPPVNAVMQFSHILERQEPQFRVALPKNIDPQRYIRILRTAVNSNERLLGAAIGTVREQNSFWVAVMKAAASGLAPDGREGFINVYNTNLAKKGEKPIWSLSCEWQPMIYGIYKQLRANPNIHSAYAHVVRDADVFHYTLGDRPEILHQPDIAKPDSSIVSAYAIVKLANGEIEREVMSRAQIESVRAKSKAPDSLMWTDFYDQACCKTVMRRLAKRIPAINDEMFGEQEEEGQPVSYDQPPPPPSINLRKDGPPLPEDHPEEMLTGGLCGGAEGKELTEEEKAHTRGFADAIAGMERKAIPPEYRGETKTDLAAKWLEGWTEYQNQKEGDLK